MRRLRPAVPAHPEAETDLVDDETGLFEGQRADLPQLSISQERTSGQASDELTTSTEQATIGGFDPRTRSVDMQIPFGPHQKYLLEFKDGLLVLTLPPHAWEVQMTMDEAFMMVTLVDRTCLVLSRELWYEYLAARPAPGSSEQPGISGFVRWALRQPHPASTVRAGEQPMTPQERRRLKKIAHTFDTLGREANGVIAAALVLVDRERARLGNIRN
jgi:hypothetical protein